jgi:transcriptional regulator with XRE-family HTH domain
MIPFGHCLTLWRKKRGLSQAALAEKAGVPQPNLSDMERGEKEISLRTLRALALALEITPGVLADGLGPETEKALVLTRDRLERIAQAVAQGKLPTDPQEKQLAGGIAWLMKGRLRAAGQTQKRSSQKSSKTEAAWLTLSASYRPEEIQSLVERVSEKAGKAKLSPQSTHTDLQ